MTQGRILQDLHPVCGFSLTYFIKGKTASIPSFDLQRHGCLCISCRSHSLSNVRYYREAKNHLEVVCTQQRASLSKLLWIRDLILIIRCRHNEPLFKRAPPLSRHQLSIQPTPTPPIMNSKLALLFKPVSFYH